MSRRHLLRKPLLSENPTLTERTALQLYQLGVERGIPITLGDGVVQCHSVVDRALSDHESDLLEYLFHLAVAQAEQEALADQRRPNPMFWVVFDGEGREVVREPVPEAQVLSFGAP